MQIEVRMAEYRDVEPMRGLYRAELNCQIIHDSFLARGLSDPYLILVDGRLAGYGAVSNKYGKGRLNEFYTAPRARGLALPMFRELLAVSEATHIETQTNSPLMLLMLFYCGTNVTAENVLFHDGFTTDLTCARGVFRAEKDQWAIESDGAIVAGGGMLCHYNPPYGDIYLYGRGGDRAAQGFRQLYRAGTEAGLLRDWEETGGAL